MSVHGEYYPCMISLGARLTHCIFVIRPVGPGYDKGRGERLREEVDHRYKCDYFKWASDVKRETGISQSSSV